MQEQEKKLTKLRKIIQEEAFLTSDRQKIIWSDGSEMDWICDMRNVILKPEVLKLITDILWQKLEKEYPFQIGAQEVAGIPLVAAFVLKSQQIGKPVNGFFIRKSRKKTGLQKIIEGELNQEKIILVDDLMNTGGTILRQISVLEKLGKKVDTVLVLVNFYDERNTELLKQKHVKLIALFSLSEFDFPADPARTTLDTQNPFKIIWHFQAPDPSYFWVVPKSTPCIDEKKIYFGSDNGTFWALNQIDGSVVWTFKVGYSVQGKSILSSPAIHKDKIYFGSYDGNVYALDKETGKMKWKNGYADWVGSSPAIAPDLGMLFIGLEFGLFRKKGGIAALDLENGEKVWDYRMSEYVHCSPAYCPPKKIVAIGGNDHYVYMFKAKNGKLLWKFKTGGDIKASFDFDVKRNLVLFGSFDNNLYALDIDTGEVKGKFETKDYIYSTPKIYGDNVYFTSTDKNLYCMNLDTGKLNWRFAAGGRIFSSPEVADEKILIGATNGVFYEIDAKTGKPVSLFQTTERITNKIVYNSRTKKYFVLTYANEIYHLEK